MTYTDVARKALVWLSPDNRASRLCYILINMPDKKANTLQKKIMERLAPYSTVEEYLTVVHGVDPYDESLDATVQEYRRLWLMELARELDALEAE